MSLSVAMLGIGLFSTAMLTVYLYSGVSVDRLFAQYGILIIAEEAGLFIFIFQILSALRKKIRGYVKTMAVTEGTYQRFLQYDIYPYAVFLGSGFTLVGVKINYVFLLLLLVLFALAQLLLLWLVADRQQKERWLGSLEAIPLFFFISGFAALIYQVVWQRVLFTTFGINIESVTVIVSVFMFGLGLGALAGGLLQKRFPKHLLECFIGIEIAIGVFGLFSIPLIQRAGALAPPGSLFTLIGVIYALLAIPTMLMGATLPLLVTYLQAYFGNLGKTVGKLYAFNTFGSALAAVLTVTLLFVIKGQQAALIVAFFCNLATAAFVYCLRNHIRNHQTDSTLSSGDTVENSRGHLAYSVALLLSAVVGYASLSLEILWFRIIGFMTGSMPQVFGLLLGIFLAGVAKGSLKAKRASESGADLCHFIYCSLLWLATVAYISLPLVSAVSGFIDRRIGELIAYAAIGVLAYFSGGIFPALCHMGIAPRRLQQPSIAVAWMYFCNIIGATLGSLITGFVLMDRFTLQQNVAIIFAIILIPFAVFMLSARWHNKPAPSLQALAMGVAFLMLMAHPFLYTHVLENLQDRKSDAIFKYVNENRSGIITVEEQKDGDIIYGNGVYDGKFNIDPVINSNAITRAYLLAAFHPHPERILEIGLSSGSWAKVYTRYKPLRELISVEINPGYMDVIAHYPDIATILKDPKVHLQVDDGRRWLNRHPDARFDVIVMNTTYYWRSNATNLLSREFLALCKQHLNPGGMVYYNNTGARDSLYTAAHVFNHVVSYRTFIAASDHPFDMTYEQKKKNLLAFVDEQGKPLFAYPDPKYHDILETMAKEPLNDIRESVLAEKGLWLITDDNMASEYKIAHHFLPASLYYALWGEQ